MTSAPPASGAPTPRPVDARPADPRAADTRPADPRPAGRAASRLVALDALRLVAALAVVVYHFTARESSVWGPDQDRVLGAVAPWTSYGSLGPELFFVISGFVILMSAWGRTTVAVVASRIGRLYPSYWVAVLLTGLLLLVVWPEGKHVTPGQVAVNLTMLQSALGVPHVDGVYWTLWTELRFYVLVGVLVLVGVTRRRVLAVAFLWPPVALGVAHLGLDDLASLLVADYAPLFAAGMALFVVHREGHAPLPWAAVAANTALAVVLVTPSRAAVLERVTGIVPSTAGLAAGVVLCVVLVAAVALTPLARLDRPAVVAAAALTYPLYLVHQYWGLWTIGLVADHVPAWVAVAAAVAVSVALAWAVHRLVEAPYAPALRRRAERTLTDLRDRLLGRVNHGPRALHEARRLGIAPGQLPGTPPT
ncbi:acyltransferase [Cellulomonas sp. JZ18]|uniref:acyltransferase family protein n=1 Tax=Cellulomonas sp. JZ18 TaxID=2654191 RepID=UPI0018AF80DA|nr:acyltransferase [Cellulomonas sp. JZ18]